VNQQIADALHMARALRLAQRGLYTTDPNPRVGCVLVQDSEVVGEGWHQCAGEAHAEVHALRAAGERARGATAFVTLEPCSHHGRTPPCSEALIEAKIARALVAMPDPNPKVGGAGVAALRQAGIEVKVGLLQRQAEALNPGFISRIRRGRPFVRAKLAASLDGHTATCSGESKWITGEAARLDVQRWRARSSAIMTGIETVLKDDPRLSVRSVASKRQPLRVVVDSRLRMPLHSALIADGAQVLLATCAKDDERAERLRGDGVEVLRVPGEQGRVDLSALMQQLAVREINEVLLESGATLCGAMLQANLVDELIVYLAPCLLGANAQGMFELPALTRLQDRVPLEIQDVRAVGDDWRVVASVRSKE
jgi:diaminohydroxyphosphoribosylaminopyrimidine deaminase/5-amino-6-(5-phosphoribosylamino)uracil reductase